jgi:hypothetical protein
LAPSEGSIAGIKNNQYFSRTLLHMKIIHSSADSAPVLILRLAYSSRIRLAEPGCLRTASLHLALVLVDLLILLLLPPQSLIFRPLDRLSALPCVRPNQLRSTCTTAHRFHLSDLRQHLYAFKDSSSEVGSMSSRELLQSQVGTRLPVACSYLDESQK